MAAVAGLFLLPVPATAAAGQGRVEIRGYIGTVLRPDTSYARADDGVTIAYSAIGFVYGHSSGAAIALRAAAAGLPVAGIVAYEAPFPNQDTPRPAVDLADHIRELVGSGRRREAVIFWMSEVVRMPAGMLAQLDGAPWVEALEPLTPTLPYDIAVTAGGVPAAELGKIAAPVLFVGGKNSPGWFQRSVADQAAATPGARLEMLDGYDHNVPPEVITPILIEFLSAHR